VSEPPAGPAGGPPPPPAPLGPGIPRTRGTRTGL
jgi:hypothetical protein